MQEWIVWAIVGAIGLVIALFVHSIMKQASGPAIFGTLLLGIAGAYLAAFILPQTRISIAGALNSERFLWAIVGSAVLSFIYELTAIGSHRSRILIPAPRR